ncbi:uncharacterized protein BCR38DRAFT_350261 [Pseudomassariella vexata]|uniref:BZIP domain-containing protein n=1 Tax=Pseudomassariella vexata TaxID=1141098 RepID=A0A1Y2DL81_9PEZI|nr:uncharacterized protein BCR38DRAFT_350261 [Pseudomassariella vexata]ORY60013.1 hypothetical protein BCR38DRAFT_350261 [Pseudomassariella vexata]
MSASSQSTSSTSQTNNQNGCVVDPLDLLDFSEYDGLPYQSPSVSPATTKPQFSRPSTTTATTSVMPPSQNLSGPSHQYDQYKQQTPFVPGALASTIALNQTNSHMGYNLEYNLNTSPSNDIFDFNTAPQSSPDMDMDFESPPEASFFFPENTINPNAMGGRDAQTLSPSPTFASNVGRMYPGMHQQAALAKAQAQQRQQQQIIQQQQQQRQHMQPKQQKPKGAHPSDPIVEQKITQLLNSMRAKSGTSEAELNSPLMNTSRPKKDEDDMDEDERLLASEEGKKLSSKERRQLRNKVSARAFRSRRKEYITQLESEIATKVTENGDLRAQNRALLDENRRLSDLTRMLLSSPSFSNFLDNLSNNPASVPQQQQQQLAQHVDQRQSEARQMPKDVNAYAAAHQAQQQQIGMVMIPEQNMDFSMLNLESNDAYSYQPQVFTVETPEMPVIDAAMLSGKSSSLMPESFESVNEKVEMPTMESVKNDAPASPVAPTMGEKTVADLDADIYDDEVPVSSDVEVDADSLSNIDLFGGVESEKALAHYQLVDASTEDATASRALMRVQRISASLEATMARLELLTINL